MATTRQAGDKGRKTQAPDLTGTSSWALLDSNREGEEEARVVSVGCRGRGDLATTWRQARPDWLVRSQEVFASNPVVGSRHFADLRRQRKAVTPAGKLEISTETEHLPQILSGPPAPDRLGGRPVVAQFSQDRSGPRASDLYVSCDSPSPLLPRLESKNRARRVRSLARLSSTSSSDQVRAQ